MLYSYRVGKTAVKPDVCLERGANRGAFPGTGEAGHSPKEKRALSPSTSILERERQRLIPMAAREHWIARIFAALSGSVLLAAIVAVMCGFLEIAFASSASSVLVGFLSKVFFSREARVEDRIREITADIRESEKALERLRLFEKALNVVRSANQRDLAEASSKELAKECNELRPKWERRKAVLTGSFLLTSGELSTKRIVKCSNSPHTKWPRSWE
jgi:hypothetical protein